MRPQNRAYLKILLYFCQFVKSQQKRRKLHPPRKTPQQAILYAILTHNNMRKNAKLKDKCRIAAIQRKTFLQKIYVKNA